MTAGTRAATAATALPPHYLTRHTQPSIQLVLLSCQAGTHKQLPLLQTPNTQISPVRAYRQTCSGNTNGLLNPAAAVEMLPAPPAAAFAESAPAREARQPQP